MSNSELRKLIYKELWETPVGAEWSESHIRSVLVEIANELGAKPK